MPSSGTLTPKPSLEGALHFVPIDESLVGQPIRLCVAVRVPPAGTPASLVLLRSAADTRVYLGAQVDADDNVREWLEVWVQTVAGLEASAALHRDYLSNLLLDQKWAAAANLIRASDGPRFIATGWEDTPARPSFVDVAGNAIWHPIDPVTNAGLHLCTDADSLRSGGLPGYPESLHRYWTVPRLAGQSNTCFYAATPRAPETEAVRSSSSVLPFGTTLLPLNPEGGRLMVRRHAPLAFEDYVDLLGGKPWRSIVGGPGGVRLGGAYEALSDSDRLLQGDEHFFLGGRGRAGRFLETFCLRLQLIGNLVRLAQAAAAQGQLPLLNLSAESFRIELGPPVRGLPLLWTARAVLSVPGQAIALPIKSSGERHFLPLEAPAMTIYRPDTVGLPTRGRCTLRLRRVITDSAELTSVEATFITSERLQLTPHTLLWIKLPLAVGATDLYGRIDTKEGLAHGEGRFHTVPQRMEADTVRALREAEGNTFSGTPFESIPMLSTPCDLYALGVLAVRALLVNSEVSIGVVWDDILSLARQLGQKPAEDGRHGDKALRLSQEDSRWIASLGAHRLSYEPMTPEAAFALLPEELWWDTIATIARFFPVEGGIGYCRDFGDVSNDAIDKIFDRPLADLDNLVIRARGLLFSDWAANREIASVIERLR